MSRLSDKIYRFKLRDCINPNTLITLPPSFFSAFLFSTGLKMLLLRNALEKELVTSKKPIVNN